MYHLITNLKKIHSNLIKRNVVAIKAIFIAVLFASVSVSANESIPVSDPASTFTATGNAPWPYVTTLALKTDGESSQSEKTLSINITYLPAGAQYRIYRTGVNGQNIFYLIQYLLYQKVL